MFTTISFIVISTFVRWLLLAIRRRRAINDEVPDGKIPPNVSSSEDRPGTGKFNSTGNQTLF